MQVDHFLSLLKQTKPSLVQTGYTDIKVMKTSSPLTKIIYTNEVCKCCKRETNETKLIITFKKQPHLTIFAADMLFMVLVEKKKPRDYADYHKCIAGKEFIENIDSYKVVSS